jgi:hypothetical protein
VLKNPERNIRPYEVESIFIKISLALYRPKKLYDGLCITYRSSHRKFCVGDISRDLVRSKIYNMNDWRDRMCWISDWTPVNFFVAALSLILVALNFLKMREPVLHIMTPKTEGLSTGCPAAIIFELVNMTTNYIQNISIKLDVCLENEAINSEAIHKFVGPKSRELITIDITKIMRSHQGLQKYQNINVEKVLQGTLRVRISYSYKFYWMDKMSYYIYRYPGEGFEWVLESSKLP